MQHYGGCSPIAKALNISYQAVAKWGKYVPEGSAYKLQYITGGKLKVIEKAYVNKYAASK